MSTKSTNKYVRTARRLESLEAWLASPRGEHRLAVERKRRERSLKRSRKV